MSGYGTNSCHEARGRFIHPEPELRDKALSFHQVVDCKRPQLHVLTSVIKNSWGRCFLWNRGLKPTTAGWNGIKQNKSRTWNCQCFNLFLIWITAFMLEFRNFMFLYNDILWCKIQPCRSHVSKSNLALYFILSGPWERLDNRTLIMRTFLRRLWMGVSATVLLSWYWQPGNWDHPAAGLGLGN